MPNWTQNELFIDRNAAAKYIVDGKFDFNKVIPMPDIYTAENAYAPYGPSRSGSSTDEAVIIYLTDGFTRELDDETMKLAIVLRSKDGRGGKEMNPCELCEEYGGHDCKHCNLGNPCIGCADYDMWNDTCTSEGACGDPANKWKWTESEEKDE